MPSGSGQLITEQRVPFWVYIIIHDRDDTRARKSTYIVTHRKHLEFFNTYYIVSYHSIYYSILHKVSS